jgi:phosphoenolpyruvate carboxylase
MFRSTTLSRSLLQKVRRTVPSVSFIQGQAFSTSSEHLSFAGAQTPSSREKLLREDVKQVGRILGESIRNCDPKVYECVEKLRLLGKRWRSPAGDPSAFQDMIKEVENCDPQTLLGISRSFSIFLALANSAENHHRVRRLRENLLQSKSDHGLWEREESTYGSVKRLVQQGHSKQELFSALKEQKVELVLTAHPTEVNRRTVLKKHQTILHILQELDHSDLTNYERNQLNLRLKSDITSLWETDDLRRTKPTPVDEAKGGLAMIEQVFWDAIPSFLRKVDDVVTSELGETLPPDYAPIKIASWMGGDRDGNPNVTPEITYHVIMLCRWRAATLFKENIFELRNDLSMKLANKTVHELAGPQALEPYREILRRLEQRLQATVDWTENYLLRKDNNLSLSAHWSGGSNNNNTSSNDNVHSNNRPILYSKELMDPLLAMYNSLMETNMSSVAQDKLLDTIRRVAAFGPALVPLDIRQESTRHTEALDAITKFLGIGSYSQWDEMTRRNWLATELASKRPLLPRNIDYANVGFSPTVIDTLRTFDIAAKIPSESLGAYVISQCQQCSDILAVTLLQQESGMKSLMRVVPLFETLDDLQRAPKVVEDLFAIPIYRSKINNKQEIMVGYSDSAKDAGRIAASWAQYNSQLDMMKVAGKYQMELTFFHGKGGTVGRGGNPALFKAILAHPPNTIQGRFRITEQGEMITKNFGTNSVAERTFDLLMAGVFSERFTPRPELKKEWMEMMEKLSETSCKVYREVVRHEKDFVRYFRTSTPELELGNLNVGSRPAKRNPKGGIESLRAIPWNFAWTQTRLNLPTWLGVGDAFQEQLQANPKLLREMFQQWPWFNTLIDLLEMVFIKSDTIIAENYDKQLIASASGDSSNKELVEIGAKLRAKLIEASKTVLEISGRPSLQADNGLLLRSLAVRNPYIDPLNFIQAEVLKRLRKDENENQLSEEEKKDLRDTLLITINGIANGMGNSG